MIFYLAIQFVWPNRDNQGSAWHCFYLEKNTDRMVASLSGLGHRWRIATLSNWSRSSSCKRIIIDLEKQAVPIIYSELIQIFYFYL